VRRGRGEEKELGEQKGDDRKGINRGEKGVRISWLT
jgi:hypothetical protein